MKIYNEGFIFWRVDLQKDFMNEDGALYVPDAESIKMNVEFLARIAIQKNIPMLGSMDWHNPDDPEFETFPPHCLKDTDGAELIQEATFVKGRSYSTEASESTKMIHNLSNSLEMNTGGIAYRKSTIDIFDEPFIIDHLIPTIKGKVIVVYGVATEFCVKAAVLGFLERGFKVIVVDDAIMGVNKEAAANAIMDIQIAGAQMMNTESIAYHVKIEGALMRMRNQFKEYLLRNGIKSLILGVSGGIDSGLTAAIISPIAKEMNIPLIGAWIGIESNTEEEHNRGMACGIEFCDEFIDMDFTHIYQKLMPEMVSIETKTSDSYLNKVRRGNIKARMRMIYLYNLAHERQGIVLGTGNYTEICMGFWTLHGDVGDYNILSALFKTEVYSIAQYLVEQLDNLSEEDKADTLQECIKATPTDGLGISESDNDQLDGYSFEEIDKVIRSINKYGGMSPEINHPIAARYRNKNWKRKNPQNFDRRYIESGSFE